MMFFFALRSKVYFSYLSTMRLIFPTDLIFHVYWWRIEKWKSKGFRAKSISLI